MLSGGLDTSKIEKLINSVYDSKKLYNSKIAYGVMSYNATINVDDYLYNSIFITAGMYSVQYYTLAKKISTRELPCQSPVSYNISK